MLYYYIYYLLYCYINILYCYNININITINEVNFQGKIFPAITMNNNIKIGYPLHIKKGELLSLLLKSDTSIRDVSIHWHGFEMKGKQAYDGVVGLTQCAIRPNIPYLYNFTVDEIPGTYWYHTHSGLASGQWHEFIKGPLIVHKDNVPSDAYITPFSYSNERIIFLQDMLKLEPNVGMQNAVGGLSGVITRGRTGDIVGTHPWLGGIINGAENESEGTIINVEPDIQYRFRIINGGDVFAFNFSIPGIKLNVISTDGADLPCDKPIEVDSIFIWTAERYDILVTFPQSLNGQTILYTARTLESPENGYNHYVNGLIRVGTNAPNTLSKFISVPKNPKVLNCYVGQLPSGTCIPFAQLSSSNNQYCKQSSSTSSTLLSAASSSTTTTIKNKNSFNSFTESLSQSFSSSFFQTQSETLLQKQSQSQSQKYSESNNLQNNNNVNINTNTNNENDEDDANSKIDPDNTVVHFVDFLFNPPPQYSHMVSLDGGPFTQHVNPYYPLIDSNYPYDLHPSSVLLDLELGKTVIIIMRTSSLMQHPMHFHGHKFEVLDQYTHEYYKDCSIFNCPLTNKYSIQEINKLKHMPYTHILKDTTVIPAGGAVVIRFPVDNPGYWLVHCHIGPHKDDGMTFIIHESTKGNTSSPWAQKELVYIPPDYPICLPKSTQDIYPSCACYHDTDQLTSLRLKHSYICSRDWICHHDKNYNTQIETFIPIHKPGIKMHQLSPQTPVVLSVIFTLVVCFVVSIYCYRSFIASKKDLIHSISPTTSSSNDLPTRNENYHDEKYSLLKMVIGDDQTPIIKEFLDEWELTYRDMINPMRLIEVGGLAVMTGIVFFEVGENHTNRGLRECVSLFFFSVTLWTFTRMYPSIPAHHGWRERVCKRLINKDILAEYQNNINNNSSTPLPLPTPFQVISWRKILKLSLIRSAVYLCAEGWWPFVFGLIAYPMAHVNGQVNIWFQVIGLIIMNNLCYISFGSVIGTIVPVVQVAMISSTLYSQMSLVCAGFYTTLPIWLSWFRYISYVFYTYSGIVKGVYRSTDSYQCFVGDGRVGQDWCLLETAGVIEDMKIRGINTADSGDPNSSNVSLSFGMLICYYCINILLLYAALLYHIWKTTKNLIAIEQAKLDVANNDYDNDGENNGKYNNGFTPFETSK